ncbi:4'-phosphopantetheinyl transferase superfamily protein [Flavobacteriaceae bacterium MHTCC 0001]
MQNFNFNDIHHGVADIWVINSAPLSNKVAHFYNLLSEEERHKANKFKFEKDRSMSIIARGALRYLIGNYLTTNPKRIAFTYGDYGKPEIDARSNLNFNVSHSGELIVIGFVNHIDIGVDVEFIKTDFDVLDIVDHYFSKAEIDALYQLPKLEQTEAFYRGWTRKEAFIKAKGKGLSLDLHSFSITMDSDNTAELYETQWDTNEKLQWQITPFKTLRNYKAAIALKGNATSIRILDIQEYCYD